MLAIAQPTNDQKLANQLAEEISSSQDWKDEGAFEGSWKVIKEKISNSGWYNSWEGAFHERSRYYTLVPASVADKALELNHIRRNHDEDWDFDFDACDYRRYDIRVADHENGYFFDEDEMTDEEFWEFVNSHNIDFADGILN